MLDVTNTYRELERSGVVTAVLPVGAIEQHGPHLPLSVDWAQADAVARGVAERLNAFLLPGIPYGNSQAHAGFRGSISLAPETLAAVVRDITLSLIEQGFWRIAVLNFHGGNLVLKITVREVNLTQGRGKVVLCHPWLELGDEVSKILESAHEEQHAGEMETSMMLHLAPEQVGDERIDHVPDVGPVYFDYAPMKDFCPDGVWGRPSLATADKGKRLMDAMVESTTARIEETFRRLDAVRR
jgi:creatinine amidohydrolase